MTAAGIGQWRRHEWTEAEDALLRKLADEGQSAKQIAAAIGLSKGSIIGRAQRRGIPLAGTFPHVRKPKAAGIPRKPRDTAAKPVRARPAQRIQPHNIQNKAVSRRTDPVFVESVAPVDAPVPLMLSLMDLTEQTCRFPIGDPKFPGFGFCGHQTADHGRYCSAHRRIVYLPLTEGLRQIRRTIKQAEVAE